MKILLYAITLLLTSVIPALTLAQASPTVRFNRIWLNHNEQFQDQKGMWIHLDMDVTGMQGKACQVSAFFYDANGTALNDLRNVSEITYHFGRCLFDAGCAKKTVT